VLAVPARTLISGYLCNYIEYQSAGNGTPGSSSISGPLMLPGVLPVQYLTTTLSGLGDYSGLYGPAVLLLLGALLAGTDWGRGTITTALVLLWTDGGQGDADGGGRPLLSADDVAISLAVHRWVVPCELEHGGLHRSPGRHDDLVFRRPHP
jgi:hypothetical protein